MKKSLIKKMEQELDVEFLPDTATHKNRIEIPSESSNNLYIVSQTKKNEIWQCACLGFRRWRNCKHLKAIVPMIESAAKPKAIEPVTRKAAKKKPAKKAVKKKTPKIKFDPVDGLYQRTLEWIAFNDEPLLLTIKEVSDQLSVVLTADVWITRTPKEVAKEIIAIRKENIREEKEASAWAIRRKLEQRSVQTKQGQKRLKGKVVKSRKSATKKTRKRK